MTYKVVYDQKSNTTKIEFDDINVTPVPRTDWDKAFKMIDTPREPTILDGIGKALAVLAGDVATVIGLGMVIALSITIVKIFI